MSKMRGGKNTLGFSLMDEMFFNLICNIFSVKLQEILSTRNMFRTQKEVVSII